MICSLATRFYVRPRRVQIRNRCEQRRVRFPAAFPIDVEDDVRCRAPDAAAYRPANQCPLNEEIRTRETSHSFATFDEQISAEMKRFDRVDFRHVWRKIHRHPSDQFEKIGFGRDARQMTNVHYTIGSEREKKARRDRYVLPAESKKR